MRWAIKCAILLVAVVPVSALADITGHARIIDGDTIEVQGQRIRLHGIDAPESAHPCSKQRSEESMEHWVYENFVHNYATVHLAECVFCNAGRGLHGASSEQNSRWLGPFDDQRAAFSRADGTERAEVRGCSVCLGSGAGGHVGKATKAKRLPLPSLPGKLTPTGFEALARRVMSGHFGTKLSPGKVPGVHKTFDLVSADRKIVGDAKYYTLVRGYRLPPAKFSVIAEHVWLLEKTATERPFLVFGNDRRVPLLWLERYENLLSNIAFYYVADNGQMEVMVR